jgi:hypothetical protein
MSQIITPNCYTKVELTGLVARGFVCNKTKADFVTEFKTIKARDEYITKWSKRIAEYKENIKQAEVKNREHDMLVLNSIETGSIFYAILDFEQIDVSFYQVVGKKGRTLNLREVSKININTDSSVVEKVIPNVNDFVTDTFSKRFNNNYIKISSYVFAQLWNGRPIIRS